MLKGFRHPTPTTVSRTTRILSMLLGIVAKPMKRDKFEVSSDSVAYLAGNGASDRRKNSNSRLTFLLLIAALVSVSEEVRSRCHVRHHLSRHLGSSSENLNWSPKSPTNRRQKSWDLLDQGGIGQNQRQPIKQVSATQVKDYAIFKGN